MHAQARLHCPPLDFYFWTFGHRALFLLKRISFHTIAWNKSLCLKLEVDLAVYGMRVGEKVGTTARTGVAMWEQGINVRAPNSTMTKRDREKEGFNWEVLKAGVQKVSVMVQW